jgi:hypothetical protein
MPSSDPKVRIYEDLAEWEHEHGSPQARDRFLILAADAALAAGSNEEAERFRARLLEYNPHHLLKPYPSLTEALKSSEVHGYIADLRSTYPVDEAQRTLSSVQKGEKPTPAADSSLPPLPPPPPLLDRPVAKMRPAAAQTPAPPEEEEAEAHPAEPEPIDAPHYGSLRPPAPVPSAGALPPRELPPLEPEDEPEEEEAEEEEAEEEEAEEEEAEEEEAEVGGEHGSGVSVFITDTLFVLMLLAGAALLGYTLARPFLSLPDAPFFNK